MKHREDLPDVDAMLARVKSVDLDMDTRLDAVKTIKKLQVMVWWYGGEVSVHESASTYLTIVAPWVSKSLTSYKLPT